MIRAVGRFGGKSWLRELGGLLHRRQRIGMLALDHVAAAVVAGARWRVIDEAERRFRGLGGRRRPVLAAHALAIDRRLAIASYRGSAYAWRLYPHVLSEMYTALCETCLLVAVVESAADRETISPPAARVWLRER